MKKNLLIIIIFILGTHIITRAQITFQKHISFATVDILNAAIQTSDNNYVLAGGTWTTSGHQGIFITKLNTYGDTLWTRSYGLDTGSQRTSRAKSIVETSDGGFFVTGFTQAFSWNFQFCLLRLDSLGDTLWTRTVDHPSIAHNYGYSGLQTSDGNFVAFGRQGKFDVDFFLNKFDTAGSLLWSKSYDMQGENDFGNYVYETSDHGFIMGGTQNEITNQNILIIKADSAGNYLWGKKFFGGVADECNMVRQTSDGGYLIAGNTQSFGAGYNDVIVIKTNSIGDTIWTRALGTANFDQCTSFRQTADQGYILTGETTNPFTNYNQYMLIKLDMNGNLLWSKAYGVGYSGMLANDVTITNDNGFLICGEHGLIVKTDEFGNSACNDSSFTLSISSAPLVISSITPTVGPSAALGYAPLKYSSGAIVSNHCFSLGIGPEPTINEAELSIYPSPANEKLNIDLHENIQGGQLFIYSIIGSKEIEMSLSSESKHEIDVHALPPGAYLILVKSEKGVYAGKFIRQ